MSISQSISRRAFMRAVAGCTAAIPMLKVLEREALADGTRPLRFLGLFSPHGKIPEYWDPQGTETSFNLTYTNPTGGVQCSLSPLDKLKAKVLITKGLSYKAASEKGYAGHDAVASAFTGTKAGPSGASVPTGPSIDQVISDFLVKQGTVKKIPSLQFGLQSDGTNSGQTISYRPGGQRMPNIISPLKAYQTVFAGVGGDAAAQAKQARLDARHKSVLDYLNGDLKKLRGRLGANEWAKLDAHAQALSQIEATIGINVTCSKGTAPAQLDERDSTNAPTVIKALCDITAQAFACDITRVATLMIHMAGNFEHMPYIGLDVNPHDGLVHLVGQTSNSTTLPWRVKAASIHNWYATQVAYLLAALDSIKDVDGNTVLDNTVVYWTNELGNPALHDGYDIPIVLAGAKGIFRTGRFVSYAPGVQPGCTGNYGAMKCPGMVPHNQLLVSIQNAFGITDNTFGDADYPGPLPNLT